MCCTRKPLAKNIRNLPLFVTGDSPYWIHMKNSNFRCFINKMTTTELCKVWLQHLTSCRPQNRRIKKYTFQTYVREYYKHKYHKKQFSHLSYFPRAPPKEPKATVRKHFHWSPTTSHYFGIKNSHVTLVWGSRSGLWLCALRWRWHAYARTHTSMLHVIALNRMVEKSNVCGRGTRPRHGKGHRRGSVRGSHQKKCVRVSRSIEVRNGDTWPVDSPQRERHADTMAIDGIYSTLTSISSRIER